MRPNEDLITAWIDGELDERERRRVEAWFDEDPEARALRDELLATRATLGSFYAAERASAPQGPGQFSEPAPPRRARSGAAVLWGGGVAAAVLVSIAFIFSSGERAEAGAKDLVERAASRYVAHESVELWVRVELPDFGGRRSERREGGGAGPSGPRLSTPAPAYRVLLRRPDLLLVQPTEDPRLDWAAVDGLTGFDGELFWRFDAAAGEVVASEGTRVRRAVAQGLGDQDLVDLVSWGFVRELETGDFEVRETTWPADRRVGRRVFELTPRSEVEDGVEVPRRAWSSARLTIDPETDRIERLELDIRVFGLSLVRIVVDVAAVDEAVDTRLFRPAHHLGEGVPVRVETGEAR